MKINSSLTLLVAGPRPAGKDGAAGDPQPPTQMHVVEEEKAKP